MSILVHLKPRLENYFYQTIEAKSIALSETRGKWYEDTNDFFENEFIFE